MPPETPMEQLFAAWLTGCWLTGLTVLGWWGAWLPAPQRPHLRLVAVHGRRVGV